VGASLGSRDAPGAASGSDSGEPVESGLVAERRRTTWARRALTLPGYLLGGAALLAGLPIWLVLALLGDLAMGAARRRPRTRATVFFVLYAGCELVGIFGALAVALAPPRVRSRALAALQRWWTDALFFGSVRIFSMRVEVEGLEHARRGPLLFFVRHTSSADTVLTAALIANPSGLAVRYVLKRELLWDPCLDLVGQGLPNAFVARGHGETARDLDLVARLARGLGPGDAVLIYPEGTRFSPDKLARAQARLEAQGDDALAHHARALHHVLPPRRGGALTLLEAAPGADVVFVEHTGFEGAATLGEYWRGGLIGRTVRVRLRRVRAEAIPREGRDEWLFREWREVDRWVERQGELPPDQRRAAG
jgi:1-acyl-sn-glycerol-3-phosphate acyltransferase